MNNTDFVKHARAIPMQERLEKIKSFKETELHELLKKLFERKDSSYLVEITHGRSELGKDLILYKQDPIAQTIVGVVVKTGSIKAKTLGEVDEIRDKLGKEPDSKTFREVLSQMRQARSHGAQITASVANLQINQLILATSGDISNEARTRLTAEIRDLPITFYDLKVLVEEFTEFLPETFFNADIVEYAREQIVKLEGSHWLSKKNVNFSESYVEPLLADLRDANLLQSGDLRKLLERKKIEFSRIESLVTTEKKILLVGEAGVGKSGCMIQLALNQYKNILRDSLKEYPTTMEIPIMVNSRRILDTANSKALLDSFSEKIKVKVAAKYLLVDGLDEVPEDQREKIVEKATTYGAELNCPVIITTRHIDFVSSDALATFKKFEILHFEYNQALKFLGKFAGQDKNKLTVLRNSLDKILGQIPLVPLSLSLLIELAEENQEIPATVTELYARYLEMLFGKWDKEKGLDVLFDYHVKSTLLMNLAHDEFFQKNRIAIGFEELYAYIDAHAQKYGWDMEYRNKFSIELQRLGILNIKGSVTFQHRTFLDYFVATYIYENRESISNIEEFVAGLYAHPFWEDVAFFYVGLKKSLPEKLLSHIFSHAKRDIPSLVSGVTVGRLLQAGWHSSSAIKKHGIELGSAQISALREELIRLTKAKKNPTPQIYIDFFIFVLVEHSYRSLTILPELKAVIAELVSDATLEKLTNAIFLFKATIEIEEAKKRYDISKSIIERLATLALPAEEEMKFLNLLGLAENNDSELRRLIKKRAKRVGVKQSNFLRKIFS